MGAPTWSKGRSDPFEISESRNGLLDVGQLPEGFPALGLHRLGRVDPHQVRQLGKEFPPLEKRNNRKRKIEKGDTETPSVFTRIFENFLRSVFLYGCLNDTMVMSLKLSSLG